MKNPTVDLFEEHGGIILMLKIMEQVAKKLHAGADVDRAHLQKILEFLSNFADKCHHGKEEGILFPELLKSGSNETLINELLGEHKTGRDYIRGMKESFQQFAPGSADAIHIAVNAEGYIRLLTEHIRKENDLLFPVADRELSAALKDEIFEKFEILERDVIGEGKHEEYHGWLKELKAAYL
jgi:hemerythrin-like domain-containing protein